MSIIIGRGGHGAVADLLLEYHRAHYRPRPDGPAMAPPPLPAPAQPARTTLGPGAAVGQVLVIRLLICVVLWAAGATVYGAWQLGTALTAAAPHGPVTCARQPTTAAPPRC